MVFAAPSLEKRFTSWCRACGSDIPSATSLWSALVERYSEPHRYYHRLSHIRASLDELDRCVKIHPLIEGAIWFHDVIYDPQRNDNEAASIAWFEDSTCGWLKESRATRISSLIEATDFRNPRTEDPDAQLMIDIDLAILSSPEDVYDAYSAAIRKEYSHVPDKTFRIGRSKVMAGFLERPIYQTPHFTPREDLARANITREIARLIPGPA